MQFRMIVGALVWLGLLASVSTAQPPEIDSNRWDLTGGVALTQTQGVAQGDPFRLTWGFARELTGTTSIPSFGAGSTANSNLIARLDALYPGGSGTNLTTRPWFTHFQSVFNRWSSISGLSYQYEAADDGVTFSNSNGAGTRGILGTRADIRIGGRAIDGNSGILAFNFFPNTGEMVIDTNDSFFNDTTNVSRGLRNVVAHEHGHGLGMDHLFASNSEQLMEPFVNNNFDGPQYHDILVAQRAYGDANEKSFSGLGNDVVARATAMGVVASGGSVSVGDSARTLVVDSSAVDFVSIDDNTDTDFWSFSVNSAGTVNVLLEALGFSYLTQPQDPNTGNPTGSNVNFNTLQRSNLALTLFDTNGTSQLASVNATGLGGNESIPNFFLAGAGTYFLRITGADNADSIGLDTQFYGLSVGFTAVPEPAAAGVLLLTGLLLGGFRRRRTS